MAVRFPFVKRRDPALSDIPGYAGGNLQDQLDEDSPNQSPDRMSGVPSSPVYPQITVDPNDADSAPPASAPALSTVGAPPAVPVWNPITKDSHGRPVVSPTATGDPEHILERKLEAVNAYEPKPDPKWRRFAKAAIGVGSMFAGAAAHDPRAVAVAARATGERLANPSLDDDIWKATQQKELNDQVSDMLTRREQRAKITNLEAIPEEKAAREKRLQQGVDTRGKSVSNARMKAALDLYHKEDYVPGANPAFDKYLEDSGLHDMPARKAGEKWQYIWSNGELLRVPKSGDAAAGNVTLNNNKVVDPSRVADQSVKLPNGTMLDHLTPREKAVMEGRVYESEADRKSRESIAANAQTGATTRAGMRVNGSPINPSVRGAVGALSKFRQMTSNIDKQKAYYGPNADDPSTAEYKAIQSLYQQRDAYEADMKKMYGSYIELDENGKPKGLRDDAVQSGPNQGLTIEGAVERFKAKNKRAPNPKEVANMQAAIDAIQ